MSTVIFCHCGNEADTVGINLADVCLECLTLWLEAGEPEACPCQPEPDIETPRYAWAWGTW